MTVPTADPLDLPLADALARLASTSAGLSAAEAAVRLQRFGANVVAAKTERALVLQFLARFRNPLVLLLLAASVLSAATGDIASCVLTASVVMLSVTLDFVQEHRAGRAAERLRRSVATRVQVLRDGVPVEHPAEDLVPGDVVQLASGDLVPADLRLLAAHDFFVNQALLTGEPYPVEKHATEVPVPSADLTAANHAAFMGTSVLSGSATGLVCRTGANTAVGEIGGSLQRPVPDTAFEQGTRHFGALILRLAVAMVGFVLLVNTMRGRSMLESMLFATALAVGLTPELLPMIVTVTLARGALRMARHKVIVKRLAAIHDLGSMDVLCTDKTGTLTEARIRLERHVDALGQDSTQVLQLAFLNSIFESGLRSPLDEAILRHEEIDATGWAKIDEVPFDFERRRVSVLVQHDAGERLLVVKGAIEDITRLSRHVAIGGTQQVIDADMRASLQQRADDLARQGFRVLGVASKQVSADLQHAVVGDEADLVFTGFAAFEDPPKTSAAAALQALHQLGVRVLVVTGDNELVTEHVCSSLGVPVVGVLTGADIANLDDQALEARAEKTTLFCRVNPAQKSRVILALKRRGHVVGYLGDGINDAPPLHAADVGISVDTAADVAKEAADMILLEHDLGVLRDGVVEGRRTYSNTMKYVMMSTSSNFGNMFSMAAASLFLPFLPLLPSQVLLNNFLYDVSEIPIPADAVDAEAVARPHRWDMRFIRSFMLVVGPVSSVFDLVTFAVLWWGFHADERLFHTGWFMESMATQVLVIFLIRTQGLPWRSRPAPALLWTSLGVVALAVALPYLPVAETLGFVPLPPAFLVVLMATTAMYLGAVAVVKRAFFRRFRARA